MFPVIVVTTVVIRNSEDPDDLSSYVIQANCRLNDLDDWDEVRQSIGRDNLRDMMAQRGFTPDDVVYLTTMRVAKTILDTYLETIAGIN